jgi:hypothetical protein
MKAQITLMLTVFLFLCKAVFSQNYGAITVDEDKVVAEIEGVRRVVGYLAMNDDPFFGFGQTYAFNPTKDAIAYIGEEKGSFELYVYSAGEQSATALPDYGEITGRTVPVWSPGGDLVTYSMGNRIWVYDRAADEAWVVTEPDEPWYEDIDPYFSDDGESIFFYRGTTFEYSFSGELYNVGLDGSGLTWVEEADPLYPSEYFGAPEEEDPYIHTTMLLIESRAALFAADLENHDYERLLTYFPAWFVMMVLEMSGDIGGPVDEDIFDNFLFNGAAIFEDYSNTVQSLDSIDRVISHEVRFFDFEVYFTVRLYDGRQVTFFLIFDQDTLQFSGAFG